MSNNESERSRWRSVIKNDAASDGDFLYAVKTTGIYCRPGCKSRRPLIRNVVFFETAAEAELAGYRPCKRCTPDRFSPVARDAARVARACRMIDASDKPPRLEQLAKRADISPYHFHRLFKKTTGLTPHQYAIARRHDQVRSGLANGGRVTDTVFDAGYDSSGHFYSDAKRSLGMSPKAFRDRGAGSTIRFAVAESKLGSVIVAGTDQGICAISLGDNPERLVRELQDRFANAELVGDDPIFGNYVARVVGFVQAPGTGLNLPLDIRGTVFQQRVWQALRQISCGETASYTEIAERIGSPKAARAVARACASNPLALAIPCHRVVRTDGGLSGYRWGIERKRELLENERAERRAGSRASVSAMAAPKAD